MKRVQFVKGALAMVDMLAFEMEQQDKLYCISSGTSATSEIERDVILAEAFGADAKVYFISERLEKHEFFDPIKRLNLKTLSELAKKTTIKSSQNKIIEYRQQSNIAFQLLVRSQCDDLRIDLPPNFRDICARLFDMVVRKSDIIFSTDMYLEN